ncbi:hypothetical protein [Tardiphaga sp.]|uniref:hypothetical protein n=1 Tax=Tardiphaga sp. TaxID=1926292 RepID=UPI00260F09DF|nr:hypothetical protein [Tardiphaga sp.]MDB5616747.1 hypothetical protein [Tardiphaga sp.]
MKQHSHRRWFGTVASLAAAYALVLNVVLSSLLLASVSPAAYAAGFEICAVNPDHGDAGKTSGQVAVHCPVCVFSHAPGAPPQPTQFLTARIAITIAPSAAREAAVVARLAATDHQARAPPLS